MSVPKARISVDGRNRLVVTRTFRGRRHEADVEGRGKAFRVGRVAVDGRWSLTPEHDLKFSAAGRDRAGLSIRVTVRLDGRTVVAGEQGFRSKRVSVPLTIADPELWWPNTLGAQPLYDVTIDLVDSGGALLDSATRRAARRQHGEIDGIADNRTAFSCITSPLGCHSLLPPGTKGLYGVCLSEGCRPW